MFKGNEYLSVRLVTPLWVEVTVPVAVWTRFYSTFVSERNRMNGIEEHT